MGTLLEGLLAVGMIGCAVLSVRAERLISASLWLAGVSVFAALILYRLGAVTMAVIELSLSVGLITILLVFAISMVGANAPDQPLLRPFNVPLVAAALLLVACLSLPFLQSPSVPDMPTDFVTTFWQDRQTDVFAQIALIFSGVLGVLGVLADPRPGVHRRRMTTPHRREPHGRSLPTPAACILIRRRGDSRSRRRVRLPRRH